MILFNLMSLLLKEPDVRSVLTMPDLIDSMEQAIAAFSAGSVNQPVRTVMQIGGQKRTALSPQPKSNKPR